MVAHAIKITKDNFDKEVIKPKSPAIMDFWAEWCMPCKAMSPIINEIAKEFNGKIKIGKINVDESTELAADLMIMNIPTLVFFREGKEIERVVGVVSKKDLMKKIEEVFGE